MVSREHDLSVRRQCGLLSLARSNLYYQPKGESAENLRLMGNNRQAVLANAVVWIAANGPLHATTGP